MKTEQIILYGALGYIAYKALSTKSAPTPTGAYENFSVGAAPTPTNITPQMVVEAKKEGLDNAQVVNLLSRGSVAYTVKTSKGNSRTLVTAPAGATKTSLNGNQYLAPRSGGGYKIVGARNIKLNP